MSAHLLKANFAWADVQKGDMGMRKKAIRKEIRKPENSGTTTRKNFLIVGITKKHLLKNHLNLKLNVKTLW